MSNLIGTLLFFASRILMIGGGVVALIGALIMLAGFLGITLGSTTNIVLFGVTIALGVLGEAAIIVGLFVFAFGLAMLFVGWLLWMLMMILAETE